MPFSIPMPFTMKGATHMVFVCLCLTMVMIGCAPEPAQRFEASAYPQQLREWNVLWVEGNHLSFAQDAFVYELNSALFSDYALKLRTVHLPEAQSAIYDPDESFVFPVGTIVSKTFFYPRDSANAEAVSLTANWSGNPQDIDLANYRLIETRLLIRQAAGWDALPYVWQGTDAVLKITGDLLTLAASPESINYLVPSRNQCASCHATDHTSGAIKPIGLKARHLNRSTVSGLADHQGNQLTLMAHGGLLEGLPDTGVPVNVDFKAKTVPIETRARAYLDINCGHCHNPAGAADTSGLMLDQGAYEPAALGLCKPPIAAGRGSGGHLYSIVPGRPDESIMTFRMASTNPASMMPELGRSLVHDDGVAVVREWIASLEGECR